MSAVQGGDNGEGKKERVCWLLMTVVGRKEMQGLGKEGKDRFAFERGFVIVNCKSGNMFHSSVTHLLITFLLESFHVTENYEDQLKNEPHYFLSCF